MRIARPATSNYGVNDAIGEPLFVITAEANAGMVKMLPPVLDDLVKFGRPNKPPRPWLGIYATEIGDRIVIAGVADDVPAEPAGVQGGGWGVLGGGCASARGRGRARRCGRKADCTRVRGRARVWVCAAGWRCGRWAASPGAWTMAGGGVGSEGAAGRGVVLSWPGSFEGIVNL